MRPLFLAFLLSSALIFAVSLVNAQDVLFEENFDDGTAEGFEPDNDLWLVNDAGQYEIENWGFEILSYSYYGQYTWTDFMLSVDVRTHDSVHNAVCFRVQENGDMYVATLRGEPYKDVFLFKVVDGHQYQLHTAQLSNSLLDWHHLEVLASGNHIVFSVDGDVAFSYDDNSTALLSGRQALISYTGGVVQHQLLQVDNILVLNPVVSAEFTSLDRLKTLFR